MLAISSDSQDPHSSALCALRSALCALRSALCALHSPRAHGNGLFQFGWAFLALLLPVILVSGCGPRAGLADLASSNPTASLPSTLLKSSISHIDLGTIARGGNAQTTVWLCNNGATTVEIAEINTSCECFQVTLAKKILEPRERTQAKMKVDFAHEPNFTGSLGLRAEGVAKTGGELAFVLSVDVIVN